MGQAQHPTRIPLQVVLRPAGHSQRLLRETLIQAPQLHLRLLPLRHLRLPTPTLPLEGLLRRHQATRILRQGVALHLRCQRGHQGTHIRS